MVDATAMIAWMRIMIMFGAQREYNPMPETAMVLLMVMTDGERVSCDVDGDGRWPRQVRRRREIVITAA